MTADKKVFDQTFPIKSLEDAERAVEKTTTASKENEKKAYMSGTRQARDHSIWCNGLRCGCAIALEILRELKAGLRERIKELEKDTEVRWMPDGRYGSVNLLGDFFAEK